MTYSKPLLRAMLAAGLVTLSAVPSMTQAQAPMQMQQQMQQQGDPPARVGSLSQVQGTVAFAPAGETEWADAPVNRPLTVGDRLWADRNSRAEVHMGTAVLHLDGQTFIDFTELDADVLQASLNDGSLNARVRELQPGENFEIGTPQLAFRATQPGDYRIDVDAQQGVTTVLVRSGAGVVYGVSGQPMQLQAGRSISFAGQNLEVVRMPQVADNGFDRWAQDRNRAEDQSVTARYIPRDVVGYQQLDAHGSWSQDASYGAVWYPRVEAQDWAPYRYGRWDFIAPWGWTWVDDAPWGFAPFHYGRWAQIGSRWAWVPGRIGPRPVYSPALVAFVGGGGGIDFNFSLGGPGIGWFPLGPGEAWRPTYRTSTIYLSNVNRYYEGRGGRYPTTYVHQQRPGAWTSVRVEDFNRGRPVNRNWQPVIQGDVGRAQVLSQPQALPQPRRFMEGNTPAQTRTLPPPQLNAPGFTNRQPPRAVFERPQGIPPAPMVQPREQTQRPATPFELQQQQRRQGVEQRQQQPQVQQQPQREAPRQVQRPAPMQVVPQAMPQGGRAVLPPPPVQQAPRAAIPEQAQPQPQQQPRERGSRGDPDEQGRGRGNRGG